MKTADAVTYFQTKYKLAKALGLKPATVYGSWGLEVPRKYWERLEALSGGVLTYSRQDGNSQPIQPTSGRGNGR